MNRGTESSPLERLGDHLDRPLFALALADFELPVERLELASANFLCLLAADFTSASNGEIARLAQRLIENGASYFVCWGPDCERAHDLIDDVTLLLDSPTPDDSLIMTTWHANEPLDEALFFFLCSAWPDRAFEATSGCLLGVSLQSEALASRIRDALAEPHEFVARMTS